jgi:hypothetical protein
MRVQVDYPNEPDDAKIEILGLGMFDNHSETDISDEQVDIFTKIFMGYVPQDADTLVFGENAEAPPEDFVPDRPPGQDQRPIGATYFEGGSDPSPIDDEVEPLPVEEVQEPAASTPPNPFKPAATTSEESTGGEE